MKKRKNAKKVEQPPVDYSGMVMNDALALPQAPAEQTMIRTQIYLNHREHDFLRAESRRKDMPMAAVIREFIDQKMEIPSDAWNNNPILEPWPKDPAWKSPEDAAINHDHYIYGSPKKWVRVKGKYVEAPPLPEDYHDNQASRKKYDDMLRKLDETK